MAIKDQCANCTKYDTYGQCSHFGGVPSFDSRSCDSYCRCGGSIDLTKHTDTVSTPAPTTVQPQPVAPTVSPSSQSEAEKKKMFRHPFSFNGRIRRLEFGLSFIIYVVIAFWINVEFDEIPLIGLLYIPLLWFWWAQLCKRFHDRNLSGIHILTLFIPLYNIYVLVMQFFADGDKYENDYGVNPKGRNIYG